MNHGRTGPGQGTGRRTGILLVGILAGMMGWGPPGPAAGSEIILDLSGKTDFPGRMSLSSGGKSIRNLCFLGMDAKGSIERKFLNDLAESGIPEGDYIVSDTLPDEKWPTHSFSANDALRLRPASEDAKNKLAALGKRGVAVHGRDFYPLSSKMTNKKKMVSFYSDRLFARLWKTWGSFRVSNWDMQRLYDFYLRNTESRGQWKVLVVSGDADEIKDKCEPLKTKRKPDE